MRNQSQLFPNELPTILLENPTPNPQQFTKQFHAVCNICLHLTHILREIEPIKRSQKAEEIRDPYNPYYQGFSLAYATINSPTTSDTTITSICDGKLSIIETQVAQMIENSIQRTNTSFEKLQHIKTYGERANAEEIAIRNVRFTTHIAKQHIENLQKLLDYIETRETIETIRKARGIATGFYNYDETKKQDNIRGYMRVVKATGISIQPQNPSPKLIQLISKRKENYSKDQQIEVELKNRINPITKMLGIKERKRLWLEIHTIDKELIELEEQIQNTTRKTQAGIYIQRIDALEKNLISLITNQ